MTRPPPSVFPDPHARFMPTGGLTMTWPGSNLAVSLANHDTEALNLALLSEKPVSQLVCRSAGSYPRSSPAANTASAYWTSWRCRYACSPFISWRRMKVADSPCGPYSSSGRKTFPVKKQIPYKGQAFLPSHNTTATASFALQTRASFKFFRFLSPLTATFGSLLRSHSSRCRKRAQFL
jgi:hypothetical protein